MEPSSSSDDEAKPAARAEEGKTKKKIPQSDTSGVHWDSASGKWFDQVYDRLQRKRIRTKYFVDEADCKTAIAALRAEERARFEAEVAKRMAADPTLTGLSRAPAKAGDAMPATVYWHVHQNTKYVPYRAVVRGKGGTKPQYVPACQDCHQMAHPNVSKGPRTHCIQHGGGGYARCPHGQKSTCRVCNPNVTNCVSSCSSCGSGLYIKRQTTKGGNGLCAMCEEQKAKEAAEAGADPPAKSERWEDSVLNKLVPKVVDVTTGFPFPYEMRDSRSHMLGSVGGKRRRSGECDTTKQRRPDLLYVVREPDRGRIVAALKVGVDEHSHDGYDRSARRARLTTSSRRCSSWRPRRARRRARWAASTPAWPTARSSSSTRTRATSRRPSSWTTGSRCWPSGAPPSSTRRPPSSSAARRRARRTCRTWSASSTTPRRGSRSWTTCADHGLRFRGRVHNANECGVVAAVKTCLP